ncbi:MAG TPA: hypothetical protein VGR35_00310 [Tepidisphaeraceae bacterium]|nr:hypothetical protein [Tepidisphaeraceae bacterium]
MSEEIDTTDRDRLLDTLDLTQEERDFAIDLSADLMDVVGNRLPGLRRAGIRAKAVSAAVAITLQAVHRIEQGHPPK